MNSVEDNYQHFLSYSGIQDNALVRHAYFHGADVGLDRPQELAALAVVNLDDSSVLPNKPTDDMLDEAWPNGHFISPAFDKQGAYADLITHRDLRTKLGDS